MCLSGTTVGMTSVPQLSSDQQKMKQLWHTVKARWAEFKYDFRWTAHNLSCPCDQPAYRTVGRRWYSYVPIGKGESAIFTKLFIFQVVLTWVPTNILGAVSSINFRPDIVMWPMQSRVTIWTMDLTVHAMSESIWCNQVNVGLCGLDLVFCIYCQSEGFPLTRYFVPDCVRRWAWPGGQNCRYVVPPPSVSFLKVLFVKVIQKINTKS